MSASNARSDGATGSARTLPSGARTARRKFPAAASYELKTTKPACSRRVVARPVRAISVAACAVPAPSSSAPAAAVMSFRAMDMRGQRARGPLVAVHAVGGLAGMAR
jgi:hypothetical protein